MLARMRFASLILIAGLVALINLDSAFGQNDVRYYQKDGVTFRETRTVVKRPVVQTQLQPRERTVYREQVSTEYQAQPRTIYTPVTTYQWKSKWYDALNPFKPANAGYHLVPQTQWQAQTQYVDTPVVRRAMIPQTQIVDVPVTSQRYVDEEVIRRTVVNTAPGTVSNGAAVASRTVVGGTRVESDPPRGGSDWRPAGESFRR